jgi:putative heme-binding domain-containing protein
MNPCVLSLSLVVLVEIGSPLRAQAEDELSLGVRTTEPLSSAEQQTRFKLPPGFEIQLVTSEPDIHKPMNMAFDAAGRLWVTTSIEYPWAAPTNRPGRDRLMIFEDFGPDGRARKTTEFAGGLNIPTGVYPYRSQGASGRDTWKAIVWSIPHLWLLEDADGDGRADRREPLYGPFDASRDTHGNLSSFRRGFDGWLHGTHGFNNDSWITNRDGSVIHMNSGNTWRARLDGSRLEHHTHGQVNPFGLTWDHAGNLYSSDCHSAPIYQLLAGGWYPSFGKPHDGLGFAPAMIEHAHGSTAIDGACYYTDDLWPAEYQDTFFIGNVMTSRLNRDRITFAGSTPRAIEQPDFLTSTDPWFRPVDTCLGPDGALYIADFYNRIIGHYEVPLTHPGRDRERGRLWRVIYRGSDGAPRLRPAALPTAPEGLIEELGSPSLARRLLAMNDLADRFSEKAVRPLEPFLRREANELPSRARQRIAALWLTERLRDIHSLDLGAMGADPNRDVRVHAMRVLAEHGREHRAQKRSTLEPLVRGLVGFAHNGLIDGDALVQRCAAEALGTWPQADHIDPLLRLLADIPAADTHLRYVVRAALRDHLAVESVATRVNARTNWSPANRAALTSVALAVPGAEASRWILRSIELGDAGGIATADGVRHVARHAAVTDLEASVPLLRRQATNAAAQRDVFTALQQGLAQRGVTWPPALRAWGVEVTSQLLAQIAPDAWNNSVPDTARSSANPWDWQERPCADGTRARLLSSHPRGETLTGTLTTPIFFAPPKLTFWLAGHDGPPDRPAQKRNRVRLMPVDAGRDARPYAEAEVPRNDTAQRIEWDLAAKAGRPVQLEITDGDDSGAYAWLGFGRIEPAESLPWPAVSPAELGDRVRAAAAIAVAAEAREFARQFGELAKNPALDLGARAASARAWAAFNPGAEDKAVADLINNESLPASWRGQLGGAYFDGGRPEKESFIADVWRRAPRRFQVAVTVAWAGVPALTDELLGRFERGEAPASLLTERPVRDQFLKQLPGCEPRLAALTTNLPAADAARQQLVDQRRTGFAGGSAQIAEGRRLFQQHCAACHQVGGEGGLVGPQLTGIGARGVERLCEDILDPNRNVDHAFAQTILTLKDGETLSGLFRREEGQLLVLANAAGGEFTVPKADVKDRRDSALSLMPDNFGESIPAADFNHLLAYLLSQR